MSEELRVRREEHIAVVTIARPPANYFDVQVTAELADTLNELAMEDVRAVVLCSEGKHFCAGFEFSGEQAADDRFSVSKRLYEQAIRLFRSPIPIVAAVQGSAVGGGFGLACAADFRVASESTRFHANFSALGIHQGFGMSESLPAIVGHQKALELLYTSRRIDGRRAHQIGLADTLSEPGQERTTAIELAREIARAAPLAVRSIKRTLRSGLADRVAVALDHELTQQSELLRTFDSQEGIRASLSRQTPNFKGM